VIADIESWQLIRLTRNQAEYGDDTDFTVIVAVEDKHSLNGLTHHASRSEYMRHHSGRHPGPPAWRKSMKQLG